jgi:hypothetical protein
MNASSSCVTDDMTACVEANIAMAQTRRLVFVRRQWINLPMFEPANSVTSATSCAICIRLASFSERMSPAW